MRRRVALAVALPAAAVAAVAAIVLVSGERPGGRSPAAGAQRTATAVVARRTLVDRAQIDGTLGYAGERPAMDRLGGTLTWLPRAGAVVRPGERLLAVDGEPVVLMDGGIPAWRTLASGVSDGADVQQLERGLAALGYDPGTVDASFTAATAAAVRAWQEALGLPETGRVELGRVAFLPGPRRIARVDASLGSGGGGGGGGSSPTADGGGDDPSADDDGAGAATKVLTTTSTVRVVTADLGAADQQLARLGTAALVALPDGRRVRGRVIRVGTVVTDGGDEEAGDGGGDPTLPLTIRLRSTRAARRLDEAPVAVELTRTTRRDVLAVPVAALFARSGGGYAVRVVRAGGATATVSVQPGLFADGWVEIADGSVREGDRVQVPR